MPIHVLDQLPVPSAPVIPQSVTALSNIARVLAQRQHVWRRLIRFDPDQRFTTRVAGGRHWEAWLLTWLPGQSTGLHDHGGSAGALAIVDGALEESVPASSDGGRTYQMVRQPLAAGTVRAFGRHHVHDVANPGAASAISLHVYAPALTTMTRYQMLGHTLQVLAEERAGQDW